MEEQPVPISQPPPPPAPPPAPPSAPAPTPKPVVPPALAAVTCAVIVVLIGVIGIVMLKSRLAPAGPAPTPTPAPATPTPEQPLSDIATQSAFLRFSSSVASLSAAVSEKIIEDPSLAPPVLTLPLGF